MVFESLSEKIQNALNKITGKGKVSEKDVDEIMREVKIALLEADVNFRVVKDFIKTIKERAIGREVMESLTPGQQVVKIVNEELTSLMGNDESKLNISSNPPTIILLCGLQGAGKTTTAGKLSKYLKDKGKRPLLVACDVYRPAAIKQLEVVGEKVDVPVFSMGDKINPVDIAKAGVEHGKRSANDIIIIDTAGRLHVNESLMNEIKNIKEEVNPDEILLVLDSMTGQDAVNVAQSFNEVLSVTGVILTKLDGDTRGGAALSIRAVTDVPIKFITKGEKFDQLEVFHPDRMASRILGMGDVLSLIEKAQKIADDKNARALEEKIKNQTFTLDDFLDQLNQMKNMGPLEELLGMMPGINKKVMKDIKVDEKHFDSIEAIILSMTKEERIHPEIINSSRRKRIAMGSGTDVRDVNGVLKQFKALKKMMKQFSNMGKGGISKRMKIPFPF